MLKKLTKTTTKKFYNKWLYKVTLDIPGISATRIYSNKEVLEFLHGPFPKQATGGWLFSRSKNHLWANRQDVLDLYDELADYTAKKDYGTRVENCWIDIYTNDENLYHNLSHKFSAILVHRYEPKPETIELLDQKVCVVDKLPKGRYQYRVYLTPHKIKDQDSKESFISWMQEQRPRVTFTGAVESWFRYTVVNWDRRYVLVEDEGTLLMMKLKNANAVGKVNKYVVADK